MKLFPGDYVESTYIIDFRVLYQEGYRALLFDVDNTLVPHNAPADDRAKAFFRELDEIGFRSMFVSNNKEPRVKSFCEAVGAFGYVFLAGKPRPGGYLEAVRRMGATTDTALFIGDQLLTDIWGANNAEIRSVLVKPVLKWHEEIQIVLKRLLEAIILFFYGFRKRAGKVDKIPLKGESS